MAMYLFIYTLIGFALAYLVIPAEPTLFRKHFYAKTTAFISHSPRDTLRLSVTTLRNPIHETAPSTPHARQALGRQQQDAEK